MGQIRRLPRLPTLRLWSRRSSRRLAHPLHPRRIRTHLAILGVYLPIFCRRKGSRQGLGPAMVLDLSLCVDIRRGHKYRSQFDRPR